jgi:hypothetical protein
MENSKIQKSEICMLRLLLPMELAKKYAKHITVYILIKSVETIKCAWTYMR